MYVTKASMHGISAVYNHTWLSVIIIKMRHISKICDLSVLTLQISFLCRFHLLGDYNNLQDRGQKRRWFMDTSIQRGQWPMGEKTRSLFPTEYRG